MRTPKLGSVAGRGRGTAKQAARRGGEAGDIRASVSPTGRLTPALGRDRVRTPDSSKRAPFAARVARTGKSRDDRSTAQTPAHIRAIGVPLDHADRDYLRRKLGRKLGKFGIAIERVSVRIEDVNGPRGGADKRCEIKTVLSGLPSVVVTRVHHSLQAAMDGALERVGHAVGRALQRRRTRSMRRPDSASLVAAAPQAAVVPTRKRRGSRTRRDGPSDSVSKRRPRRLAPITIPG